MNVVVLPLSALQSNLPNFANRHTCIGWCVLVAAFGVPIAFGAARYYQRVNDPRFQTAAPAVPL